MPLLSDALLSPAIAEDTWRAIAEAAKTSPRPFNDVAQGLIGARLCLDRCVGRYRAAVAAVQPSSPPKEPPMSSDRKLPLSHVSDIWQATLAAAHTSGKPPSELVHDLITAWRQLEAHMPEPAPTHRIDFDGSVLREQIAQLCADTDLLDALADLVKDTDAQLVELDVVPSDSGHTTLVRARLAAHVAALLPAQPTTPR